MELTFLLNNKTICLSLFNHSLLDELYPLIMRNQPYLYGKISWIDSIRNRKDLAQFLKYCQLQQKESEAFFFAIYYDERLIGTIDLHSYDWINHSCQIGYWLDFAYMGRGIMTHCLIQIIQFLMSEQWIRRVEIIVHESNQKSRHLPEKLGFTNEGYLAEQAFVEQFEAAKLLYSLSKQEYLQKIPIWQKEYGLT